MFFLWLQLPSTAQLTAGGAGPLNIITPANVVAAIMTYAWPFVDDTAGFIIIAVIYGYANHPLSSHSSHTDFRVASHRVSSCH